jgi:hypothetical protein
VGTRHTMTRTAILTSDTTHVSMVRVITHGAACTREGLLAQRVLLALLVTTVCVRELQDGSSLKYERLNG